MQQDHQGDLADLWAVGGKLSDILYVEGDRYFYRFCPQCGWKLTGKFSTCPCCGADLRLKLCPYCGGEIPAKVDYCPRCIAPLE